MAIGTVVGIHRYPVKSMAGEQLVEASVSWAGIAGDRRWAFVRADSERSGFPWQTIREDPSLLRHVPRLVDPDRPDRSEIEVRTPGGDVLRIEDPALAASLGDGVRLMRLDRGAFDAMPLSLITMPTVAALCGLAGVPAEPRRFRPNLVIMPTADVPFVEDEWVGSTLHIGSAAIRIDARDGRCVVVNVNPMNGHVDASLLKVIGAERDARAGVYGTTASPGQLAVGDTVHLAT